MRYVSPVALPVGLGEWLGAELEARGVESASLYARAVISILLQSDMEPDLEPLEPWSFQAAMEVELKLERQKEKENKRGRPRNKQQQQPRNKSHNKSGVPINRKEHANPTGRRRPHSWNGDEDDLKKSAAIECLLSATDEKWPVEKLVDELYARVKLLQLESPKTKWNGITVSSAPVFMPGKLDSMENTTLDSDSFTTVSTPEGESENYFSAFPPLDTSSPCAEMECAPTAWAFPLQHREPSPENEVGPRVPFVRVTRTRLSPTSNCQGNNCPSVPFDNSEAYFGDCSSRDSSLERPVVFPEEIGCSKGRLYQRGGNANPSWEDWASSVDDVQNIWAPCEKDLNLLGQHAFCSDLALDKLSEEAISAVQQSLAVLNHNPKMSSFAEVVPSLKYLGSSKLFEWMGAVKRKVLEQGNLHPGNVEEDNLLISPKTHFCPIQDEAENEVNVKDGATFNVDAKPDKVHFLRSPSGALYLPETEENGESGWGGWTKYMVYNPLTPPPCEEAETVDQPITVGGSSPFPLKFRVLQTEKYCQTDISTEESMIEELQTPCGVLLSNDDVWKFDAQVLKEVENAKADEPSTEEEEEEEEDEVLLKEVFNYGAEVSPTVEEKKEEADLDELWNPLMADGEGYDVCEWVSQDVYEGGEEFVPEDEAADWPEAQWAELCPESWPPPYIPVEYLDDELFDEIFGSVDSKASSNNETKVGTEKKSSRRRKRNNSQKRLQAQQQHRKRPCSFFVEGECLRPDCKFSHDLGTIPCRFWLESACFKGDACPFMHAKPTKTRGRRRSYSQSDADASENVSGRRGARHANPKKPNFELDLENDFPSLSQAVECKITKSQPIPINAGAAAVDLTGSSAEGNAANAKRRRRKPAAQRRVAPLAAPTSSDSSPCVKKGSKKNCRRRSVSEQGNATEAAAPGRLRLSSSYKEG